MPVDIFGLSLSILSGQPLAGSRKHLFATFMRDQFLGMSHTINKDPRPKQFHSTPICTFSNRPSVPAFDKATLKRYGLLGFAKSSFPVLNF